MHNIIFISTIHKEIGECTAEELYKIIKKLSPEVIFLEAVEDSYTSYEHYNFTTYGVFHRRLEISAIQKYHQTNFFEYVPVCVNSLSDAFQKKNDIVCKNRDLQILIEKSISFAATCGFNFLNSLESMNLQEEMRVLESQILKDRELDRIVKADIEAYEVPMIQNIYSYCKNHQFDSAVFMCGAAHRKSIIEKVKQFQAIESIKLNWTFYSEL
jgi:hypothetical protein